MKKISQFIDKGEVRYSYGGGRFFLLYYAVTPVTVRFYRQGRGIGESSGVTGGLSVWLEYDEVRIDSSVPQEIGFFMSEAEVRYEIERASSFVTTQDFFATVGMLNADMAGQNEDIAALMLAVDIWNVPTIEAIEAAESNLQGMVAETNSTFNALRYQSSITPQLPQGSQTEAAKADIAASAQLAHATLLEIGKV